MTEFTKEDMKELKRRAANGKLDNDLLEKWANHMRKELGLKPFSRFKVAEESMA